MAFVQWPDKEDYVVVENGKDRYCVGCYLSNGVTHHMLRPSEVATHMQIHKEHGDKVSDDVFARCKVEAESNVKATIAAEAAAQAAVEAAGRAKALQ